MSSKIIYKFIIIVAISIVIIILNTFDTPSNNDDVEIILKQSKTNTNIDNLKKDKQQFFLIHIRKKIKNELENQRKTANKFIDSYEIEISDFWREVLNNFEIFEYYKAYPEAFIRRLTIMPIFTGKKDYLYEEDIPDKPIKYPDNDYRSIKYRYSLVPDTITTIKAFINWFYNKFSAWL